MSKGFVVLLPIELMLSKSGSNLLHFATYLLRFLLRIGYISATFPATYLLHVDHKTAGPASFWHQVMSEDHLGLTHYRSRRCYESHPNCQRRSVRSQHT